MAAPAVGILAVRYVIVLAILIGLAFNVLIPNSAFRPRRIAERRRAAPPTEGTR